MKLLLTVFFITLSLTPFSVWAEVTESEELTIFSSTTLNMDILKKAIIKINVFICIDVWITASFKG